jgi:uncharacterized membrane protein YgcG
MKTNDGSLRSLSVSVSVYLWPTFGVCLWLLLMAPRPLAAERPHVDSHPRDGVIAIDGKFDDWSGNLEPLGTTPMSIQVVNDGEFLYLRLTASDAGTRMQIMRLGMTVWVDPAGGTKKKLGVRYPVVEAGSFGGGERGRGRRERPDEESGPPLERVDILGPGKDDARSLTRDHLSGVDVALRSEQGSLEYELKVPLKHTSDRPYAIDAEPGKTIGIGIETGKLAQRSFGEGRGGGFGGGGGRGGGGRGGGMRGGGSRGGGERGFQPPKPVKAWVTVTLAPAR